MIDADAAAALASIRSTTTPSTTRRLYTAWDNLGDEQRFFAGCRSRFPHMVKSLQQLLTNAGTWLSRPWAVGAVALYTILWLIFDRASFGWPGIATLATLLMTLFIQRSEHRDTQAIHEKLDELLRANGGARNHLAAPDDSEPEQVEAFRRNAGARKNQRSRRVSERQSENRTLHHQYQS